MSLATATAWSAPGERPGTDRCPRCGLLPTVVLRTREEIAGELAQRDQFFRDRLDDSLARHEVRDVTSMLLGTPAAILRCGSCGILVRDGAPDDEAFREDRYEREVLETLHAAHAAAFREKEAVYRGLLREGARVVEVGSYVGGFLAAAREWRWTAIGVDIGIDTSRFARTCGFDVRALPLEDCGFPRESFDAVFIWNCFEQLARPGDMLAECARILRPSGLLVLRVPDAGFYERCRSVAALAYNGILGWPHRFGFDESALAGLVSDCGFTGQRMMRAPAIRPLPHGLRPRAAREQSRILSDGSLGWLEATFRKR